MTKDDHLPVTEAWLEAVGFRRSVTRGGCHRVAAPNGGYLFRRTSNGTWGIGDVPLPDQPTRGSVRALCKALEVTLEET